MKKILTLLLLMSAGVGFGVGVRAESVYQWTAALTLESVTNLDGGIQEDSSELANLDLTLAIDTDAAGWWGNGEWFVYVLGDTGDNPSDDVGDVQGISNIATDEALKVYEFWYQHSFADDSVKLLFGLHDYNSTFYSLESAGLFTHPSFGIGPDTSQVGPSIFSTTSTALHFTFAGENNYLLAAIYDGIPGDPNNPRGTHVQFNSGDGLFSAVEWGWANESKDKVALGVWQHTAEVENPVDGEMMDDNTGVYFIAEKNINDVAAVFVQLGQADDEFNAGRYYGISTLLQPCLDRNDFTNEQKVRAYLLLAQAYLILDNPTAAEDSYLQLLRADPEYVANPARDPIDVYYLSKKFTSTP
ncbi:tetratricopeptide repeat protein, partial [Cellvibrio sp.]